MVQLNKMSLNWNKTKTEDRIDGEVLIRVSEDQEKKPRQVQ